MAPADHRDSTDECSSALQIAASRCGRYARYIANLKTQTAPTAAPHPRTIPFGFSGQDLIHSTTCITMSTSNPIIIVRRRWDDPESARVALQHTRELAIKDQPGGICSPVPRPFLFARVWCDYLIEGAAIHKCDSRTAPHELELCVLERDNPDVYSTLRARLRGSLC